jgi:hypothetical protein
MNDNPPNNAADSAGSSATNSAAPLDEELVAYLDGELDAESARRIEALLASDPVVRQRLQSLERTWDLLDELDAAPLGEPFTQTTLEMVAIAARQDAEQDRAEAPQRRRRLLWAVGASLLAAAVAGFCAVALYNPDRQLLQDLPLLENLDEYRQIDSIEFLHRLRDEGLFSKNSVDLPKGSAEEHEDAASRRQRVEGMSLDAKEQLLRAEDRFAGLAPAEQQRLRRLHEDLQSDPDALKLQAVMHAYYEWLKGLPPLTWADLSEGEPNERIILVKKRLKEEQQREGARRPDAKDMAALRAWMDDCATRHEADFLKSLTNEQERKRFSESGKPFRHQMVFGYLRRQWLVPNSAKLPPMMTNDDLARLREKLSPETRKELEDKTPVEQWRLAAGWMRQGFRRPFEDRRPHGPLSQSDDERLADFFEKGLTDEQRDRLLSMPGEEMQWELQRLFLMHTRQPEGPNWRNRWPANPERPAPGRSGPPPRLPSPDAK